MLPAALELARRPGGSWLGLSRTDLVSLCRALAKTPSDLAPHLRATPAELEYLRRFDPDFSGISVEKAGGPSERRVAPISASGPPLWTVAPPPPSLPPGLLPGPEMAELSRQTVTTTAPDFDLSPLACSLRDPISMTPLRIPVRGDACAHIQCFDLLVRPCVLLHTP
jgi:hypothetical protein